MNSQHKVFLVKVGLLLLPVPCLLLILYLLLDPFKVVKTYNSFSDSGNEAHVTLNRDYVSTQTFIKNYPKYKYNSFIFGNSRSGFFEIDSWKKYIHTDQCFHFDANKENLLGIYRKFVFLNKNNIKIDNALIILDYETLMQVIESDEYLFQADPKLSGKSILAFHLEFFKTFISSEFLLPYLDFRISKKAKKYMIGKHILNDFPVDYDDKYNEMRFRYFENMITETEGSFYTKERMKLFYDRVKFQKRSPAIISTVQEKMLLVIAEILRKNNAAYKIVYNPLYDQMKLSQADSISLSRIFGEKNVYDFSGINNLTNDYHNYYEQYHFRPRVADSILKYIYSSR